MANVTQFFSTMLGGNPQKRDVTAAFDTSKVKDAVDQSKMARLLDGERKKMLTANASLPDAGTPFRGMLGYAQTTPNFPGQPDYTLPTTSSNVEALTNVTIPVTRFVLNSPKSQIGETPGKHDIIFVKKSFTRDMLSVKLKTVPGTGSQPNNAALQSQQQRTSTIRLSAHPVVAYTMVAKVSALQEMLIRLYNKHPEEYQALGVRALLHGHSDYEWTGWTMDGVVLIEEREGQSSSIYDGYRYSAIGGGRFSEPTGSKSKMLTVASVGHAEVRDYWEGVGVTEGASLWLIFKKYDLDPSANGQLRHDYSAKLIHHDMMGTGFKLLTLPQINIVGKSTPYMKPLGVFPLAIPDGGYPDPSLLEYNDEWGVSHMGTAIHVGRVLFLPFNFKGKPAIHEFRDRDGNNTLLKPLVDMGRLTDRENLRILMPNIRLGSLVGAL